MATNDGIGNDVRDPFPGISAGCTGQFCAPGSAGASGRAADDTGRVAVTSPTGAFYDRDIAPGSAVTQPGQAAVSPLSPGPAPDYVNTGAGDGRAGHYQRYPWQAPDGGRQ